MSDLLKKGFYLGLGAAVSGKEKFQKMVKDMENKGEVSPSQAKAILDAWISKGEGLDKRWNEQANAKLRKQVKELGFVTKEQYDELEARLRRLENWHSPDR